MVTVTSGSRLGGAELGLSLFSNESRTQQGMRKHQYQHLSQRWLRNEGRGRAGGFVTRSEESNKTIVGKTLVTTIQENDHRMSPLTHQEMIT